MKRFILIMAVMVVITAALASSALAWHANGVVVNAVCNTTTFVYDVSATINQSQQWPGAVVKKIEPSSFVGNTSGSQPVKVTIGWSTGETQVFNTSVNLDGKCVKPTSPAPTCKVGVKDEVNSTPTQLVCIVTNTVYVDRPVPGPERIVDRPVPGPTVTVTVPGPERIVERTVTTYGKPICPKTYKKVKGGLGLAVCTKTVIKNKINTVVKVRVVQAPKPAYTR